MKLLMISDIHLGVKRNCMKFLTDTKNFFLNQVKDTIKNEMIDQLWILGDLFDNPITLDINVKNTSIEIFTSLLDTYPKLEINILCGNHDAYYKTTLHVSSLNMFLHFHERLHVIKDVTKYNLDGCKTLVVPWLIQEHKTSIDFNKIIESEEKFDLCLGHFSINGFEVIHGIVEQKGLSQSTFKNFTDVFTGHFHIRNKYNNIQYLGSPYEITWNDCGDVKGITVYDTKTKKMSFIENNICPKHKVIKLSEILKDKSILKECSNNFITLIIDQKFDTLKKEKLYELLNKNARSLKTIDTLVDEIDDDAASVNYVVDGNPEKFLDSYLDEIKVPEDIDKDILKLYISNLFKRVNNEA